MSWSAKNIYPFSAIVGQEKMIRALVLNAICPSIGGVLIRGEKGTAKSTAVRALAPLLSEIETVLGCPFNCDPHEYERLCPECRGKVKRGISLPSQKKKIGLIDLPLAATEEMVVGTIDFEYALKEGKRRFSPGLLAKAHRGILYIDEVNLLNDHIVDMVLDAAGVGTNIVEREGISFVHPSEFILIGTMNPEEGELRPQLLDRFGMCIQIEGLRDLDERVQLIKQRERFDNRSADFVAEYQDSQDKVTQQIVRARKRLCRVRISDEMIQLCSKLALDAFTAGHRADIIMRKTAISIASYEGRGEVSEGDIREAADLVLFHRARTPPEHRQRNHDNKDGSQEETHDDGSEREKEDEKPEAQNQQETDVREAECEAEEKAREKSKKDMPGPPMLEAVFPVGNPFQVKRIPMERDRILRKGSGRRSRTRTSSKAGRYIRSTMERKTNDLALDATLRAAAPFQKMRRRDGLAIAIEDDDIREKLREKRIGNFIVFVVDASGSMGAGKRMIAAKGAILSLLLDAYQKRDKVSLVAFKGDHAEVLLPPTNSLELAHKLLEELPTGGKTPLCHGISLGYQIIQRQFRKDPNIYPLLMIISDGRANVTWAGENPVSEAFEVAEEIRDDPRLQAIVVDAERAGLISFGLARQLSLLMGARYLKIEDLEADTLIGLLTGN